MEEIFEAPLIFDNVYLMSNLGLVKDLVPGLLVVELVRDPYFVCNSILKARRKRYGDLSCFYGHQPRGIERVLSIADPVAQVVEQVAQIEAEMAETLGAFPPGRRIRVAYEDLAAAPEDVARRIAGFLADQGAPLREKGQPLAAFRSRNTQAELAMPWRDELKEAYRRRFGERGMA